MTVLKEYSGVSSKSYSDAVQKVVDELVASGKKVLWFEVVEHRGAVRDGNVEFQVVVKVGLKK